MRTTLILLVIVSLTGCRSTACRHTAAKPKTCVEFEVGYVHTERSKYQDDQASAKVKWRREL